MERRQPASRRGHMHAHYHMQDKTTRLRKYQARSCAFLNLKETCNSSIWAYLLLVSNRCGAVPETCRGEI